MKDQMKSYERTSVAISNLLICLSSKKVSHISISFFPFSILRRYKFNGFKCLIIRIECDKMKRRNVYLWCVIPYRIRRTKKKKKCISPQLEFQQQIYALRCVTIKVDDISDTSETLISELAFTLIVEYWRTLDCVWGARARSLAHGCACV